MVMKNSVAGGIYEILRSHHLSMENQALFLGYIIMAQNQTKQILQHRQDLVGSSIFSDLFYFIFLSG